MWRYVPTHNKKKQEGWGRICPGWYNFSAQSNWCWWWWWWWWWTVGEVNWLCRQAGWANKQSTYMDVYGATRQHSL